MLCGQGAVGSISPTPQLRPMPSRIESGDQGCRNRLFESRPIGKSPTCSVFFPNAQINGQFGSNAVVNDER